MLTTPAGLATLGVAAAGGAYTLGHNIYSADQNIAGVQASNRKIGEQLGFGSSADDLRKAAQSLKTNAEQLKEEVGGISGLFVNPLLKDTIAQTQQQADQYERYAKELEAANAEQARHNDALREMTLAGVDATSSIEDITAGLEGLARTGVGSAERLRVLWNTLGSTKGDNRGAASDPVKAAIDAADFLNQFGAGGQDYSANDPNRAAKLKKLQEQKLEGDITFFELEGLFKDNQIETRSSFGPDSPARTSRTSSKSPSPNASRR